MWETLTDSNRLTEILGQKGGSGYNFILKHSPRCGFSAMAKSRIERHVDERISYFLINVLAHRDISDLLAELTHTTHESPQSFLFEGSRLIEVKSHMAINPAEMSRRLDSIAKI